MNTLLHKENLTFSTPISSLLMKLYTLENDDEELNALSLAAWWVEKIEDPDDRDNWLSLKLWKLYARHLHVFIHVNWPDESDRLGRYMGIEIEEISLLEVYVDAQGREYPELLVLRAEDIVPPYGLKQWIKPLKSLNYRINSKAA